MMAGNYKRAYVVTNDRSFMFSKAGVSDPLKQGVPSMERDRISL